MTTRINKTNRIRLNIGRGKLVVIYCASEVIHQIRENLVRLESIMVPKKGKAYDVWADLHSIAAKHPEYFTDSSLLHLR